MAIIQSMRKIITIILLLFSLILIFVGCGRENTVNSDYLRLHIRANSNASCDQEIKLCVRDKLITYLSPFFENVENRTDAEAVVKKQSKEIKTIIDNFLLVNNFDYCCSVALKTEEFPTRTYGDLVLESGTYRAIIINLGSGEGDNWWCVAFPPLCFLAGDTVIYKSKIWEIIKE